MHALLLCTTRATCSAQLILLYFITVIIKSLTYFMEQNSSWEANRLSDTQEIPAFHGTQKFITAFTRARHLFISWARTIHSVTRIYLLKFYFNMTFASKCRFSKLLFLSCLPIETLYTPLHSTIRAKSRVYLIHLNLVTLIKFGEQYRTLSFSFVVFSTPPSLRFS